MGSTTIIGLLGTLQGFVLAGAILSLSGDSPRPNRALALLLCVFAANGAAVVAEHAGFFGGSIWLILFEYTLTLAFAPLLWLYADAVLGSNATRRRAAAGVGSWVHFVPLIAWVTYLAAVTVAIQSGADTTSWQWLPPIMGLVLYLMAYTVAVTIRYVKRERAGSGARLVVHGRALGALLIALYVLHVAQIIRYVFRDVAWLSDIVPLAATVTIYGFSIVAFRQSRLFSGHDTPSSEARYESSTLTSDGAAEIERRLLQVMERDRPYLNENLNLSELAARLAIPRAHLSQVVNANLGSSFPELLNEYRVKEATRLLGDPATQHLTIEAIGYEVGFRSRSGFYSAYKRIANETPAQTRTRLLGAGG